MQFVLTPAEMAAADQHAIATGTPEAVLVERAGRAVARHALRMLGGSVRAPRDGRGRQGKQRCRRTGRGAAVLRSRGVGVDEYLARRRVSHERDLRAIVRARRPRGRRDVRHRIPRAARGRGRDGGRVCSITTSVAVLAVDIPSGVDGATGRSHRRSAVRANETICFAAFKPGLLFEPGAAHAGRVHVVDIGIAVRRRGSR